VDPTSRDPVIGQPGGHCYNFDDAPETWDYAGGDAPYKAVDTIPAGLWYDVSAYGFWGYDRNQNGAPDSWDVIDNLPCPLVFKRGELLLGIDLGGGNIQWEAANPPIVPMWHSQARTDVQGIYCTGWTTTGSRNFGGPVQQADGSWQPAPYDTNDDGYVDFWAYGGWWSFGCEVTEEGVSEQGVGVAACGAVPPTTGPVAPGVGDPYDPPDCFECDDDGFLRILTSGLRFHTDEFEAHLIEATQMGDEGLQIVAEAHYTTDSNRVFLLPATEDHGIGAPGGGAAIAVGDYPGEFGWMSLKSGTLSLQNWGQRAAAGPVYIGSQQDIGYAGYGTAYLSLYGEGGSGSSGALYAEASTGTVAQVAVRALAGSTYVNVFGDEINVGPNGGGAVRLRASGGRLQAYVGGWKDLLVTGE
jgi:hypothetical protein